MRYVEIKVKKKVCLDEVIRDGILFFKYMGFIEVCDETDLSAGPKEAIDVYNETVVEIEKIGQKYGLYDDKESCRDPWYEVNTFWPLMDEFFRKYIIKE